MYVVIIRYYCLCIKREARINMKNQRERKSNFTYVCVGKSSQRDLLTVVRKFVKRD